MPIFEEATHEVYELARAVTGRFDRHAPLRDHAVAIQYIFASPSLDSYGLPTGPAIKHHGMPALAVAKVLNPLDRLITHCQGRILIDKPHWEGITDNERMAILDHELYHFIVDPTDTGDDSKPLLVSRDHDFQVGWFHCVARSWGADSVEMQQFRKFMADTGPIYTQGLLNFTPDPAAGSGNFVTVTAGKESVPLPLEQFSAAAKKHK